MKLMRMSSPRIRSPFWGSVLLLLGWTFQSGAQTADWNARIRHDLFRLHPEAIESLERRPSRVPFLVDKVNLYPQLRAIILNTQNQAIHFVKEGDRLGDFRVHRITAAGVQLARADLLLELEWVDEPGA